MQPHEMLSASHGPEVRDSSQGSSDLEMVGLPQWNCRLGSSVHCTKTDNGHRIGALIGRPLGVVISPHISPSFPPSIATADQRRHLWTLGSPSFCATRGDLLTCTCRIIFSCRLKLDRASFGFSASKFQWTLDPGIPLLHIPVQIRAVLVWHRANRLVSSRGSLSSGTLLSTP